MNQAGADKIRSLFRDRYGTEPSLGVRAPGRVNLIGEHIDYVGLPVLPVALEQAVHIVLRPRSDSIVRIITTDSSFGHIEFEAGRSIASGPRGDWGNYVRAAVQGVAGRYAVTTGWDGLAHSELAIAAGLSSSSALVVAVGLCAAAAGGIDPETLAFAAEMAEAEQYVGTRGGGMDQAACLAGVRGSAVRVDFAPLRVRDVPIPDDWRFVVANSGVQARKSGAARETYNRLRDEAERALPIMWRAAGGDEQPTSYRDLLQGLNAGEIAELLDLAHDALPENLMPGFQHVVTESARVGLAERMLRRDDPAGFGRLMDASHESLREDLGVSCGELDELVATARVAGAFGARLTGAGMGGCIVALGDPDTEPELLRVLPRSFVVEPSAGAAIERLPGSGR